ncbi:MAG: adenylate/guanylate cyclase domain-containing protein [Thermoanaerobaculia bacterium]|nr:adenylate/guanylate cyclase domain-containing protein [Thermoanaerobaculia bacterium]
MRRPDLYEESTPLPSGLFATFHELHPDVPHNYYRAVVALNYCYLMCLVIHLLLIPTFFALGESFLAVFNVGSVGIFAVCLYLNSSRGNYRFPVVMATLEILLHATLCVVIFGWNAGFHYYLLALGVSTFIIPWWPVGRKMGVVAGVGLLLAILNVHARLNPPLTPLAPSISAALYIANLLILIASLGLIGFAVSLSAARAEQRLNLEKQKSEDLLHNILPVPVADRLKKSPDVIADRFDEVTILFADIVGFTSLSDGVRAERLVGMLNEIFSMFDQLVEEAGLEKIKTIGDGYMVAGGLPSLRDDHAEAVCDLALEMGGALREARSDQDLKLRIGIHSGPVVAGVIGYSKFAYDVWGDTVNTASRMESHGIPGKIHVSEATYLRVRDRYALEPRGSIEIKGKGVMSTWLLQERLGLRRSFASK